MVWLLFTLIFCNKVLTPQQQFEVITFATLELMVEISFIAIGISMYRGRGD